MNRYSQLDIAIDLFKPRTILEIGTWKGKRAISMINRALQYRDEVNYLGFDLFEDATPETDKAELNVKEHFSVGEVKEVIIEKTKAPGKKINIELVKGNTNDTLRGFAGSYDFAFIDGGHSVNTIRNDAHATKNCLIRIFDDYYEPDEKGAMPDINKYGVNAVLPFIHYRAHVVLPIADKVVSGGLNKMVMVI